MTKKILLAACLALAAIVAPASAATVPVTSLTGDFNASNSTVTETPDGVHFGTYADGGAIGGTLTYHGFDGKTLGDLTDFSYTFTYRQAGSTTGAGPYERVFLDDDATTDQPSTGDAGTDAALHYNDGVPNNDIVDDIVLDPSFCATTTPAQSTDLTYQMIGNSVRWDDDGCDGLPPDNQPYADAIAGHEGETIVGLLVSQGNSTGSDVSAVLRNITVNGTTFCFNCAPAPLAPVVNNTTVINQAAPQVQQQEPRVETCSGNILRTIHAPTRKGEKFLNAKASLRGKSLKVKGRSIAVDLRNQPEANYNVKITSRYKTHGGAIRTVKSERHISVVCA